VSENKGPFGAAINVIKLWLFTHEGASEKEQLGQAICVLEAAGKVDKERSIRTLATLLQVYVEAEGRLIPELEEALRGGAVIEIRALLESLPGKEGK
jgi:hypothetical protein